MKVNPPKDLRVGLAAAYRAAHNHLNYILTDLTAEQASQEIAPESRTIVYYLTHIANSELYWLAATGRKVIVYAKQVPLGIAKDLLIDVQERILRELKECPDEDLVFQPPTNKSKPSLGWVVAHTTLHTLYHSAEIIFTRYAAGGSTLPQDELEESWSRMVNAVSQLIFFVKQ
ncbi:MAG: DinB family protein [Candidatus Hodarchaeota archaeon]